MPKKPTFMSESKWKIIGTIVAILIPIVSAIVYASKQDAKIDQNTLDIKEDRINFLVEKKETKKYRSKVTDKLHDIDKNQKLILYIIQEKGKKRRK